MEARVFSAMAGEIVVDKSQNRIASIKGRLIRDVKFGWGLLGKMDAGGYRHLPVVDAGRPVGVISVRDVLRHVTGLCQDGGVATG